MANRKTEYIKGDRHRYYVMRKIDFWIIMATLIMIAASIAQIGLSATQYDQSLLNLSVNTTLFNSSLLIAPAFNTTLCGVDGCANYTQGSNHTFNFNISNAGYLYITSSNGQNLTIIATEAYKPPIPSSHNNKYLSSIVNKIESSLWTTAILNTTFANVVIPVVPGNATIIIYNYEQIAYYGNLKIEYVK